MTFAYKVSLNDPMGSNLDGSLISDINAAASSWSDIIKGKGTLGIQVNVKSTTRANGGPTAVASFGTAGSEAVYESSSEYELATGNHVSGYANDIVINVDPNYLNTLWLDPSSTSIVPSDKIDGLSVFMHEIGHGLGITSYRDPNTGALPNYEMVFDKYTVLNSDGSVSFVGPNAESVYGGPVSVTTLKNGEQYSHFGNSVSEPDGKDLMNGVEFDYGTRYNISNLDMAVMKDLGFSVGRQPPAAPTSLADAAVLNGHVSAANDTATQTLTGTAEANSTVTVYDNGIALAHTSTADVSGHWSYTLGQLSVGPHSLTATATDAAGNTSAASAALAFTVDSTNEALFGMVTTDPHSAGGEVYALYQGLLGRAPDTAGLEYWADQFIHGASPASLASAFLASAEGQARLGAADNTSFVEQLYQNTLHRAPDSGGLSYWTDQLAHGASRVDVADSFVFSPEFTNNTVQPAISSGLFVPDANASEVARIYYTMLGRAPDASGQAYWTDQIDHGGTPTSVAQAFLGTPENQAKYGSLSNGDYVDALYVNALGRHADSGGLSYWTSQLDHGASRADLAVQLSQSAEAQNVHLAQIEQGWHLA